MNGAASSQPRITVGITCYNAEADILRAVESARAQAWPNIEILVVDDASTDRSVEAAQAALAGASNARLIQRAVNGGVAAARNTLLAEATGEYIAFFDDDDVSMPERVAIQLKSIEAAQTHHGKPALCFASGQRRYDNGYHLQCDALGSRGRSPVGEEVVAYLLFNERAPDVFYGAGVPSCALMAPVSMLRSVGGYDEALGRVEDIDIAIRLAFAGVVFVGCPERLYIQRATPGSDKTPMRNLMAELQVVDKHRTWLESRGLYQHARSWFRFREAWFSRRRLEAFGRVAGMFVRRPRLTIRRLLQSGPNRLMHERKMRQSASNGA